MSDDQERGEARSKETASASAVETKAATKVATKGPKRAIHGPVIDRVGRDVASDRRTLLVLPGLGGGKAGLVALLDGLARTRPVLSIEADSLSGPWPSRVAAIVAELDRRGLDRVDVLAWSFGGVVAQHALLAAPERFEGAILAATAARLRARERAMMAHLRALFEQELGSMTLARALIGVLFGPPFLRRPGVVAVLEALLGQVPLDRANWIGAFDALLEHRLEGELRGIDRVRAVVCGELDWIFPIDEAERLAELVGAPLERLPGIGHALWIEAPEALIAACARYLGPPSPSS